MSDKKTLELQNLAGGALQELFENDLQKVLDNIYDRNTSFKKARKLTLELKLQPTDEDREIVAVDINTKTVLAPVEGATTKILLDMDGTTKKVVATEFGNKMKGQLSVNDFIEDEENENNIISNDNDENVTAVNFKAQ